MGAPNYVMGSLHKVDVGGLIGGGRERLQIDRSVGLEPFESVRFPEPARVRLNVRATGDLLEIDGTIDVEVFGECDRCLMEMHRPMHVEVSERLEAHSTPSDPFDDNNVLVRERLDVADLTAQLAYAAVPPRRICAETCRGLCVRCGENRNDGSCTCEPDNGENRGQS